MNKVTPKDLLLQLLTIVDANFVMAAQFERLAENLGVEDGPQRIAFLTGIKGVLRELPEKIYSSDKARQTALDAIQDALDATIDREEASDAPA